MSLDDRLRDSAAALHAAEVGVPPFRRLHRMHRIRRSLAATTTFLVVLMVAAGAYAATGSKGAVSVTPAGPAADESSTTVRARPRTILDIEHPTFAIFATPATRVVADRQMWLAARLDGGELWISREDPAACPTSTSTTSLPSGPCGPPLQACLIRDMPAGVEHGSWCDGESVGWWDGSTQGEFVGGQPVLIYGVVPDDVSRVTYDGHDIPVTNNVFVITAPGPIDPATNFLPLFYYVGNCQIPMYVQGQTNGPNDVRPFFNDTPKCSP